jgi:hypothetical protein
MNPSHYLGNHWGEIALTGSVEIALTGSVMLISAVVIGVL